MITAADIQTEIEKTERGLALLRVEINQSEVRLTALRTLLATMPPVTDAQPDPEPCMEAPTVAPTLDQSEGESEAMPEQAPEAAPTTPATYTIPPSLFNVIQQLDFEDDSPNAGWRWLPHVQHLSHQESRIRVVRDGMSRDPYSVWCPVRVATEMNMSQDQASHALSDLYKHGLVMRRKVGRIHQYKYRFIVTDQPVTDAAPTAT